MFSYTKSLSIDFPNGLVQEQLSDQILSQITSPQLLGINIDHDVVNIIFDSNIPDITTSLNNIISSYIPIIYNYASPFVVDNVLTNTINGIEYKYFGNEKYEIIISQNSQSHYNTLSAAIAANNVPNQVFIIYPGTYIENNPIVLPPNTTITCVGSTSTTILVASHPDADFLVLNKQCKLFGLTLVGASNTGSRGIYFDGSLSGGLGGITVIGECFIFDCNIGIECDGNNVTPIADTLYADKIVIGTQSHSIDKGIYVQRGGQFITTTCYVNSSLTNPITYGYYCKDAGSKISLAIASVWFCQYGLYLDNNADSQISLLNIQYNNNGVYIGENGLTTRLAANSLVFRNSVTYDLDVQATNANIEIYSSFLDDSKINNPHNVNMAIKYNANKYGNYYQTSLGDMMIGSQQIPSKLGVGEGIYTSVGSIIMTNDNLEIGTYTNVTSTALAGDGTPFNIFSGVTANNCMYIGSDKLIYGFKIEILTPTTIVTPLSDLIFEYWNGTTWIEFQVMQLFPLSPTHSYINSFISLLSKFHIRFGLTTNTVAVTKLLNGFTKYWVRLRIVNNISNIPLGNYVKIHSNSTIINNDGFIEFMGNARPFKNFKITTYPSGNTTTSQELFIDEHLSIGLPNNVFSANNISRVGFMFKMPETIDISFPIQINLNFVINNTSSGQISWTLRYVKVDTNTSVYLNSTDAQSNPNPNIITTNKITNVISNTNNKNLTDTISILVHNIGSNPSTQDRIFIYGSLERNATGSDVNDTFPGDVILSFLDGHHVSWCVNGHLLGF